MSMRQPTAEEARFFAACLEACVPGELALEAIDPEMLVEARPEVARVWEGTAKVRAARFDVRAWLEKNTEGRIHWALEKTRNGMAAYLATNNIAELTDSKLSKALKFMEALEKVVAGTAGKADAASEFFRDVLAGKVKLQAMPKTAERVQ